MRQGFGNKVEFFLPIFKNDDFQFLVPQELTRVNSWGTQKWKSSFMKKETKNFHFITKALPPEQFWIK